MTNKAALVVSSPFLFPVLAVCLVLSSPLNAPAQSARYKSARPLWARVSLNTEASASLQVVFDESGGTGTGYDLLYAHADFGGRPPYQQRLMATVRKNPTWTQCQFPAIELNVPHNNTAMGASHLCRVTFGYRKYFYPAPVSARVLRTSLASPTRTQEFFDVSAELELKQGPDRWKYSFRPGRGSFKPSKGQANAPLWKFLQTPKLTISSRPDARNPGNLGIALSLVAGENQLECKNGPLPLKADVEIVSADGRLVHRGSEPLNKFTFG